MTCTGNCNQGRNCTCADHYMPARGIVNGILLSVPIWAVIILLLWLAR